MFSDEESLSEDQSGKYSFDEEEINLTNPAHVTSPSDGPSLSSPKANEDEVTNNSTPSSESPHQDSDSDELSSILRKRPVKQQAESSYEESDKQSTSEESEPYEQTSQSDSDSDFTLPSRKRTRTTLNQSSRATHFNHRHKAIASESPSSDDDDSEWEPSGRPSKKRKRTKHDASYRTSRRKAPVRYSEEPDFSMEEDEDTLMYTQPIIKQEKEEEDTIDGVFDYRLLEGAELSLDKNDYEFLIKWKSWSHLHNTWNTYEDLRYKKGIKKVDNFFKNFVIPDAQLQMQGELQDELEQRNIEKEMERNTLNDFKCVERIVDSRTDAEGEIEYFCKWKRLQYEACTWEAASLISEEFQPEIDAFMDRERSNLLPHKSAHYGKHRPSYLRITNQPAYLVGGQLRDYQLTSLNWLAHLWSRNENGILADEMGLGKTVQTISFLSYLFHTMKIYGPFLVVVPLSTIDAWYKEVLRWAPDFNTLVYIGNGQSRSIIREKEFYNPVGRLKFNTLITTYELVLKDRQFLGAIKWAFLAVDEAHRLKNSESQLHEALKSFHSTNRLLITGTPLQNSLKELHALVDFLMPEKFKFDSSLEIVPGNDVEDKICNLHSLLRPYMLRRLKKDVEKSLPNKTERILRVELAPLQIHYYKNIVSRNFDVLSKSMGGGHVSLLNIAMELKKASNHPLLINPNAFEVALTKEEQLKSLVTNSGKMVLLDKLLTRLRSGGHRVLIFSQMVRLLDILADYLYLRAYPFQRLDGSVPSEARKKAIEHFNAPESPDFAFLLSTRAGGLGINLETADTVIIFDSDWNPQNDLQAMARAHRIGQKKTVNVYRLISKGTVEEDIIERAKRKRVLEYCIMNQMDTSGLSLTKPKKNENQYFNRDELSAILKFGAYNIFHSSDNAKKLDDLDLDEILERAEDHETAVDTTVADGGEEFLRQFQVTDYSAADLSWEDIIPETDRNAPPQQIVWEPRKRTNASYSEESAPARRATRRSTQPSAELNEKEIRCLVRLLLRFGSLENRFERLVLDTELEGKDKDVVLRTCAELLSECRRHIDSHVEVKTRRGKKNPFLAFNGVNNINPTVLLQRNQDLVFLENALSNISHSRFRLSFPLKPVVNWSCSWGQKDDAMLLVGIHKHGFGNWEEIVGDTSLGLTKKVHLDEKIRGNPKATHLSRRAEYLFKAYQEYQETKKQSAQSSHSKSKKSNHKAEAKQTTLDSALHVDEKKESKDDVFAVSLPPDMDAIQCKEYMRPVKKQLRRLKEDSEKCQDGDSKVSLIKECMKTIGDHIHHICDETLAEDQETWRRNLWIFVTFFWPRPVEYEKLISIYSRLNDLPSSPPSNPQPPSSTRSDPAKRNSAKRKSRRS